MNIIKARRFAIFFIPLLFLVLSGCMHETSVSDTSDASLADVIGISRSVSPTVDVNETFSVELTVSTREGLLGVLIEENFGGFELVDVGSFQTAEGSQLKGVLLQTSPGDSEAFRYQLRCTQPGSFTLRGIAKSKNVLTAEVSTTIECS